jgi:type I site-specific restriction endonuclease
VNGDKIRNTRVLGKGFGYGYGYAVLWGDDGKPLGLIEVKRTACNPDGGRTADLNWSWQELNHHPQTPGLAGTGDDFASTSSRETDNRASGSWRPHWLDPRALRQSKHSC